MHAIHRLDCIKNYVNNLFQLNRKTDIAKFYLIKYEEKFLRDMHFLQWYARKN